MASRGRIDFEAERRARRDTDDADDSIDESSDEEEEDAADDADDAADEQGHVRVARVLWERCDPLTYYNDVDFHRNFRFTKENLLKVVGLIKDDLEFRSKRGCPLDPVQQTCLALSFFANGSFQHVSGYMAGVKKSTACITIRRVARALVAKSDQLISMPTMAEMRASSEKLCQRFGIPACPLGKAVRYSFKNLSVIFPDISSRTDYQYRLSIFQVSYSSDDIDYWTALLLGVDGTHIRLGKAPSQSELPEGLRPQDSWCRKQFWSINGQVKTYLNLGALNHVSI
jgi:hypothetical protein